jgi:tRNA dimethylallyltransferase
MYLRGLLRGLVEAPARSPALRSRIRGWIDRHGSDRVHRLLQGLDPVSAERIAPADTQRLVRALEVRFATGEPLGARIERDGTWGTGAERYRALKVGLDMEREAHLERITRRVDGFLEAGLVEEVRGLLAAGVAGGANAFKAIGYRETLAAIEGGEVDRGKLREEIVVHTRQFAKRQRTWFRKEPDVLWLDAGGDPVTLAERVARAWSVHDDRA